MDFGLKGKIAMVAGASRGLGYAVARALAAEGAKVSLSSRNEFSITDAGKRIAAETYVDTLAMAVDVRSADSIAKWHTRTMEKFGGVDLLFVNAGGPPAGPALSFDDAAWQGAFELLVLSAEEHAAYREHERVDELEEQRVNRIKGGFGLLPLVPLALLVLIPLPGLVRGFARRFAHRGQR